MAVYAQDDDLVKYVPDIFDHGVESFDEELARSSADIERRVKAEWWNINHDPNRFDADKLKASEWARATIYHSLAYYIMPRLSTFAQEDTFQRQMTYYKDRYQEEFSAVLAAGVSYDMDGDGDYTDSEVDYVSTERLYR